MEVLDSVEFDAFCLHTTDLAILVEIEGEEIWVPRSQVLDNSEVLEKGDEGILVISGWFADKEGL